VEGSGRGLFSILFRHCLEGLSKTTKNLSQDSRSPGRDWNAGPSEYESGILSTQPCLCTVSAINERNRPYC
jgi:hypothetical protein